MDKTWDHYISEKEKEIDKIVKLYDSGSTIDQIGSNLKIATGYIRTVLKKGKANALDEFKRLDPNYDSTKEDLLKQIKQHILDIQSPSSGHSTTTQFSPIKKIIYSDDKDDI